MRFQYYSEYVGLMSSTNKIFDHWFFQKRKLDCNPEVFSKKKDINKLPIHEQSEFIIDMLEQNDATQDIIKLFVLRKKIEDNMFDSKRIKYKDIVHELETLQKVCQSYG